MKAAGAPVAGRLAATVPVEDRLMEAATVVAIAESVGATGATVAAVAIVGALKVRRRSSWIS